MKFPLFPDEASELARHVDYLYWGLIGLSVLVIVIIFVPMIYFLFKYRRGRKADRRPARLPEFGIEITWTLIPTFVFLGLFAWGAEVYWSIQHPPADAMEINIVGKQWMWKVQHPEGNREINELHVPAGRVIRLTLASQDVIHSFFLPAFRIKQDVVPGRYSTLWFKADKTGTFRLFCSEYCGTQHSAMIGRIIVLEPAGYQEWLARGRPASTLSRAGERLYRELGCSGCHENSNVVRAPPLRGIFGKAVPLQSGGFTRADEGYIRDSILLPAKDISAGYANVMPSYQGRLQEDELLELVAYIKNLATAPETASTTEVK